MQILRYAQDDIKAQHAQGDIGAQNAMAPSAHQPGTVRVPTMREYHVYILASRSRTLYIGVTNNLARRVDEHRRGIASTFTSRYRIHRLVYVESTDDIQSAIVREKQLKGWTRARKVALIESMNPAWEDLAERWGIGRAD